MRTFFLTLCAVILPGLAQAQDTLRVVFNDFRPYNYVNEAGEPAGYGVELVEALAARIGAEVEYQIVDSTAEVVERLGRGEADVNPALVYNETRTDSVIFSVPHEAIQFYLYARSDRAAEVAENWPNGVVTGYLDGAYPQYIVERFPEAIATPTATNADTIVQLVSGDLDAAVYPAFSFRRTVEELATRHRFTAIGTPLEEIPLRLAVSRQAPELAALLDETLAEFMVTDAYRQLRQRSLGETPGIFSDPTIGYAIAAIATLLGSLAGLMLIHARRKAANALIFAARQTAQIERKAADELRSKNTMLIAKNRAMEELMYVVSHDLSSPLVSISGFARSAMRAYHKGNTEKTAQYLERVEANVGSMSNLINGILQVSRIGQETPELHETRLSDIVDTLELRLDGLLSERGITLELDEDARFVTDPEMLARALQNIVENAARHGCEKPGDTITLSALKTTSALRISVSDKGQGIPEHLQPRIFEMYQRNSNDSSGSGLGLAIVSRLIEKLDGEVTFQSTEGEGTTFWIDLPAIEDTTQRRRAG